MQLEDFNADFLRAWQLAKEGKLHISFPKKGSATNLRAKLYAFRKRLRETGDTQYDDLQLNIVPEVINGNELHVIIAELSQWRRQVRDAMGTVEVEVSNTPTPPPPVLPPKHEEPSSLSIPDASPAATDAVNAFLKG